MKQARLNSPEYFSLTNLYYLVMYFSYTGLVLYSFWFSFSLKKYSFWFWVGFCGKFKHFLEWRKLEWHKTDWKLTPPTNEWEIGGPILSALSKLFTILTFVNFARCSIFNWVFYDFQVTVMLNLLELMNWQLHVSYTFTYHSSALASLISYFQQEWIFVWLCQYLVHMSCFKVLCLLYWSSKIFIYFVAIAF